MGIPDNTLLDLIEKVRSWISWGSSDLISQSCEAKMANEACRMCSQCEIRISGASFDYNCQRCNRVFCDSCVQGHGSFVVADAERGRPARLDIQSCKFCADMDMRHKVGGKYSHKIHPSDSPRQSPEPPSPDCSGERFDAASLQAVSVQRSPGRSDEEDGEDSAKHFFSPYSLDMSDVDSSSVSTRHEFYSFLSVGSSPSDSPSRIHITSNRGGQSVQPEEQGTPRSQNDGPFGQETMAILKSPDIGIEDSENTYDDVSVFRNQCEKLHKPLDFENNGHIWFPPPPEDEKDDAEDGFFSYNDDDDEMGESSAMFSSSDSLESMIPEKDKQNEYIRKPLRDVVQGHFRALISQLLQAESIAAEEWLDIITTLAWQAANFVKPDTSRGGSMDPGDYVKVKCIASGSPGESTFVKGVVCTKNIKHKRMSSQYKSPRLLLLGGALEYQRAHNQLASFDTLLQQEMDHLKMIVSRIEAHRTNVLLVEKTVSSRAQEYLLLKEISLVLNVKRPLLERIARCTGASITPSVDKIPTARLGQCELFRLEKVSEEHEVASQLNKKPSKTLMFFEGCPRRLGCTILLKGLCREDLKKVKHVIQYAVFAAYHLSLETSFLADEGAFLPKMTVTPSTAIPEHIMAGNAISVISNSVDPAAGEEIDDCSTCTEVPAGLNLDLSVHDLVVERPSSPPISIVGGVQNLSNSLGESAANVAVDNLSPGVMPSDDRSHVQEEFVAMNDQGESQLLEPSEPSNVDKYEEVEASSEYYSASDNRQCIVVSKSSRCVLNGNVCERSTLWRIKFYGINDKPLGRYLQEYLFDQACCCSSCKELVEAHVICYTHQQGNLTINVRRLPSVKLPGERDGKIWMWHRCLRCEHIDGVPPATRRVVMSDAAWGLSFGKFLELSFSNHATANRVASCGHSLQRDCLRFYGFGSTVAFFRYSPIDILSVHLPPSVLQFSGHSEQVWLRKEAEELWRKTEALYEEIVGALHRVEQKNTSFGYNLSDSTELSNYIMELKDLLVKERREYNDLLQPCEDSSLYLSSGVDVFELNRLRHALMIGLHVWDRRLYSLESLFGRSSSKKVTHDVVSNVEVKYLRNDSIPKESLDHVPADPVSVGTKVQETIRELPFEQKVEADRLLTDIGEGEDLLSSDAFPFLSEQIRMDMGNSTSLERAPSAASVLSEQIDSAWSGTLQKDHVLEKSQVDGPAPAFLRQINEFNNPQFRRLSSPVRVYSFDSALTFQERLKKGISASPLQLSAYGSFHGSGDYSNMVRDPISNVHRSYSQLLPFETQKLDLLLSAKPSLISSVSLIPEGARLLLPQGVRKDLVIAVYDNEPTSIISYALTSKEYEDWFTDKPNGSETHINHLNSINGDHSGTSNGSVWQSFRSLELDYIHYGSYGSEDASIGSSSLFTDSKSSPHLTIPFEDESLNSGKVKFSVTCYFAKQFDALRKKCCPSEVEFVRSLSRCKRWDAQGGKSNAYFAKTLDERFIIKQVSKTELESFEEFAPQYFKYLSHCLSSGTPTCLAKIVGIYQVTVKNLRGGKEAKMHVMVMENLFFKRNISRVYDLKGSERSRYNSDTTGANKTLLDMNLLETLRTHPIFLGSKAKRTLERAVWNDTNFLASIDVMDYSLLVGVDEERKELVLGIIDFMRQYTWDKHLETWVKASGILGGPKNASPTIISPLQYKRRFRKAMTSYFLTVPDNVGSS